MTDKAYIVANKEQEFDVLNKFEQKGLFWINGAMPNNWLPSKHSHSMLFEQFPYALIEREDKEIAWLAMGQLTDEEIVYDGRKEEKMYKVTQEFMNELIKWRDEMNLDTNEGTDTFVDGYDIQNIHEVVNNWWAENEDPIECNNRLIAILQWLNGEYVFELEEPHKFVVRSKHTDGEGDYPYIKVVNHMALVTDYTHAMKFDTREEAQEWANSHQLVVEIDAEGNEV